VLVFYSLLYLTIQIEHDVFELNLLLLLHAVRFLSYHMQCRGVS
jgi:hypothetical protein